ncbi:helix-turn-helix domain-containing protein [uncultured Formosa sp.]|uniref:helix-turn-helix domain-containing protein n=1 Tax=uncultured Formosa sp. TaxID=255435 RepID=UPI00262323C4|nr:helix-turn-helix domain-containing protein [uncultured Formosa sp.]
MQEHSLGKKVKRLRNSQGISQEFLAEESGLSIRTIQRIEKGETSPNGDTCRKLSDALKVSPNDLMGWTQVEDIEFLKKLNLSALTFIFFPLLGILVPALMWISKKDKVKDVDKIAKKVINFEITWVILLFLIPVIIKPILFGFIDLLMEVLLSSFNMSYSRLGFDHWTDAKIIWILMYLVNIYYIIVNTFRIHDEKKIKYFPSIKFLKN